MSLHCHLLLKSICDTIVFEHTEPLTDWNRKWIYIATRNTEKAHSFSGHISHQVSQKHPLSMIHKHIVYHKISISCTMYKENPQSGYTELTHRYIVHKVQSKSTLGICWYSCFGTTTWWLVCKIGRPPFFSNAVHIIQYNCVTLLI